MILQVVVMQRNRESSLIESENMQVNLQIPEEALTFIHNLSIYLHRQQRQRDDHLWASKFTKRGRINLQYLLSY